MVDSAVILEMILAITDGETWREMVMKACGLKFFKKFHSQSLFDSISSTRHLKTPSQKFPGDTG